LTLNVDRVILHTIVHHSSTSTYMPNVTEIEQTFCGWTYVRTYIRTFETGFISSTQKSRPKKMGFTFLIERRNIIEVLEIRRLLCFGHNSLRVFKNELQRRITMAPH